MYFIISSINPCHEFLLNWLKTRIAEETNDQSLQQPLH
ncbi:hypothetical protein SD77_4463 [Bacillus badius]|uniref:Uncharacterized protein n=1 Tax=Bacillus badius TaxID=1455 RepID=A0ABR5AX38_BACBA|nr:hypothetical protein SD77_4463 [Bacillus badius]